MPRVYLPLASAEAYGAVGEMIVFQGVTCRAYVVPYDPRTEAQLSVRDIFRDVTKMETFCGAWAKAAWSTAFGARWYTALYSRVTANNKERYNESAAVWDGFTVEKKEAWNCAAPFQVTSNAPGEVFYVLMDVMQAWLTELYAPMFEFPGSEPDNAVDVGTWATQDLDSALSAGNYDDDHAGLVYAGSWSTIADVNASGGEYHQSAVDGAPSVSFYFYGTQFSILYEKNVGRGVAKIQTFGMVDQLNNQASGMQFWQQEFISPVLRKALHFVTVTRTGTGAINIDGISVAARVRKTS